MTTVNSLITINPFEAIFFFLLTWIEDADNGGKHRIWSQKSFMTAYAGRCAVLLSILAIIVSGGMFVFIQYPGLTLVLTAAVSLSFLLLTLHKSTSQMGVAPFLYILASFMLLLMSLKLWDVFFEGHTMLLIGLLILNCALWLFAGRMLKLQYFSISGAAGLLLITGFLLVSF